MIVSIASGKGGTGKTTLAVNLALSLESNVQYVDCDVEEPNGHIFIKPQIQESITVGTPIPIVDQSKCDHCGKCSQICEFNAIVTFKHKVLIFPELCHSCAGCRLVCPQGAVSTKDREIGLIEKGKANGLEFIHGRLRIGEPMSTPLIREVKRRINDSKTVIIDAPPGTSCPVIEAVKGSDFVILVTEPTPFGLNDLIIAVEMIREIGGRFGIVINLADIGTRDVNEYCRVENIPVLLEINHNRNIAIAYSKGTPIIEAFPEYRKKFIDLFQKIETRLG